MSDGDWIVVTGPDALIGTGTAVPAAESAVVECDPDDASYRDDGFVVYTDADYTECYGYPFGVWSRRWDLGAHSHPYAHADPPHEYGWYFWPPREYVTLTDAELPHGGDD